MVSQDSLKHKIHIQTENKDSGDTYIYIYSTAGKIFSIYFIIPVFLLIVPYMRKYSQVTIHAGYLIDAQVFFQQLLSGSMKLLKITLELTMIFQTI